VTDEESGETVVKPDTRLKYLNRVRMMMEYWHREPSKDPRYQFSGLNETPWIAKMNKWSSEHRHWTKKGPVLFYFARDISTPCLIGSYLYGTKSNVVNMKSTQILTQFTKTWIGDGFQTTRT
jgi:hypothetical protein